MHLLFIKKYVGKEDGEQIKIMFKSNRKLKKMIFTITIRSLLIQRTHTCFVPSNGCF